MNKKVGMSVLALACGGLIAPSAMGLVEFTWKSTCGGVGDACSFQYCSCEGDWDDAANWNRTGYPDDSGDRAIFTGSNGPASTDCDEWSSDCVSAFTRIDLDIIESIQALHVTATSGSGDGYYLAIVGSGAATLWATQVRLDATYGNVVVEIRDDAGLGTYTP
jgi:hypothetical protein